MTTDILDPATAAAESVVKRKGAVAGLAILALTIAMAVMMRVLFSPLQEGAKASLGLTDFQLSLAQGLAASIPIAILSLPLGRMVDRQSRVRILIWMALIWTAGTALTAFAQDFTVLFAARMLSGLGGVCALPVAISLAADMCTPQTRGRSMAWLGMGNVLGSALAFALGGMAYGLLLKAPLFGMEPWRGVHLVFAGVSALLILPLLALREPARQEVSAEVTAFIPALQAIWSRRVFLIPLFMGQLGVAMTDTAAAIWAAPVLARDFHQSAEAFGPWMGLIILGSGVIGTLIGGFAADLGQKARYKGGILVGAVALSLIAIPAGLYPLMPSTMGFAIAFGVLLLCGFALGLITAVTIAVLVPNEIRGLCLSAFVVLAAILAMGVAPTLVTMVGDLLGGENKLGLALAICGVAINVISAAGFLVAMLVAPKKAAEAAVGAG